MTLALRDLSLSLLLAIAASGCTPQGDPGLGPAGFSDGFQRASLGEAWNNTGGPWRITDGELSIRGAKNRPLWLRRTLPRDVRVEFDATSHSEEGDIKVELFGDGVSRAEEERYTASSYVIILGGWSNSLNIIARMDEHADDRVVGPRRRIAPGQRYHFIIDRRGSTLSVSIDGEEWMRFEDPDPLEGRGHDHFAFNNWDTDLRFDNLRIVPL